MNIRQAEFNDYSAIAHLHAKSWQQTYQDILAADYLEQQVIDDRLAIWQARLTNPSMNQGILVAEHENALCGFVCLYGNHNFEHGTIIDNLHIAAAYKGQGIGRQLMHAAGDWAIKYFSDYGVYLEVLEENVKAKKFYQALGATDSEDCLWQSPCGSAIKCHAYTWSSPQALVELSR